MVAGVWQCLAAVSNVSDNTRYEILPNTGFCFIPDTGYWIQPDSWFLAGYQIKLDIRYTPKNSSWFVGLSKGLSTFCTRNLLRNSQGSDVFKEKVVSTTCYKHKFGVVGKGKNSRISFSMFPTWEIGFGCHVTLVLKVIYFIQKYIITRYVIVTKLS